MASIKQTPLTCSGHTRPVVDLAFSDVTPHGYFLISACKDGKPMLRQGDTGDWIGTFEGHKGAVWGATLNRDATKAATGAADFTAKLWDAESGDELQTFAHKHIVKTVAFSNDSSTLLTGSNEKLLRIFDLSNTDSDPQVLTGHTSGIRCSFYMKDDKRIISSSEDKTIRIWDATSCSEVKKVDFPSVPSVSLSADGEVLAVAHGQKVTFLEAHTLTQISEYDVPCPVLSVDLHPEKTVFVCGGEDFKMYKFDYNTGLEIESVKGHFGPVHCVRFSPDGELYASGSEDGTLRLWQTNIGKTYGLWKYVVPEENGTEESAEIKPET